MTTRRTFLKLGSLFVLATTAPPVVYSFLWARKPEFFPIRIGGRQAFIRTGEILTLVEAGKPDSRLPVSSDSSALLLSRGGRMIEKTLYGWQLTSEGRERACVYP